MAGSAGAGSQNGYDLKPVQGMMKGGCDHDSKERKHEEEVRRGKII